MSIQKKILKGVGIAVFAVLAMLAFGFLFQMLWNWLVPELFHGPVITFWQGIGLIVLFKILFGHHGGKHKGCGSKFKRSCCKGNSNSTDSFTDEKEWGGFWKERWQNMTPEEKEAMKNKWKSRFKSCADEDISNG